jgi:outer membrane protein assembly factor BamB
VRGGESGYVAALNESSGAVAWSADPTGTSIAVDGQTLYVGESPPDSLASFDATTGKAELKPKLDGSGAGPSLTVGDGRAWLTGGPSFVASSSTGAVIRGAGNTQLPALDGSLAATVDAAPRSNSFTLGVEDGATGAMLWHRALAGVQPLAPIVDNGYVWVADDSGLVRGFDEETGTPVATIDTSDPITVDQGSASLAATGGELFVPGDHGLWVYGGTGPDGCPSRGCGPRSAGPVGEITRIEPSGYQQDAAGSAASSATTIAPPLATDWGRDFDGTVSYPVVTDGSLDVTTTNPAGQSQLWALNERSGAIRWGPVDLGGINAGYTPLVVDDGVVVVLSSQLFALGYSEATGQARWSRNLSQPYSDLTVAGPVVVATGSSGTRALEPVTGRVAWSDQTAFGGRPAYADGTLYLGDSTGTEALDTADDTVRWTDDVGGDYAVAGDRLVTYGLNDRAHVVDAATGSVTGELSSNVAAAAEGTRAVFEQLHHQVRAVGLDGRQIWDYKGMGMSGVVTPLYTSQCVWILDAAGTLGCLDPTTGRDRWSTALGVGRGSQADSQGVQSLATDGRRLLVVSGDRLVVLAPAGQVAAHRPGPPVDVSALASDGQAAVTWDAPADNGASPISSYVVTAQPGGRTVTLSGTETEATVTGLTDGVSYRFAVTAVNGAGAGRASGFSVLPVTPAAGAWTVTPLQVPTGAVGMNAAGINAAGEVVGSAVWGGTNPPPAKAVTWNGTAPTVADLGSPLLDAAGTAINDHGDITAALGTNQVLDAAGQRHRHHYRPRRGRIRH